MEEEMKRKYSITKTVDFCAAHRLPWHPVCCNTHGHNYKVSATIERKYGLLDENGIVMDLSELGMIMKGIAGRLDHSLLNDLESNPTSEWMASFFRKEIQEQLIVEKKVVKVVVEESPGSSVTLEC